jgi:hypothetical protein
MEAKKLSWWKALGIGMLGGLKLASLSYAQEPAITKKPKIEVTSKTDFFSKYVYRGFNFGDGPVLQENLKAIYNGMTAWGFMNYDIPTGRINEQDLILDYTRAMPQNEKILLSAGYGVYTFPGTNCDATQEIYAGVSVEDPNFLSPAIFVFHDFKEGKGTYLEGKLGTSSNGVNLTAKLGYNDHYFRDKSGFSHIELNATRPLELSKKTKVIPGISYQKALDKDFKDEVWAGLSLEYKF